MRTAFFALTLALVGAGFRIGHRYTDRASITVKLPPARPAAARPGFQL